MLPLVGDKKRIVKTTSHILMRTYLVTPIINVTFRGDVGDVLAAALSHVTEHGEDDEAGKEARATVDGARY